MRDARIELVGAGYDVIGKTFVEWRDRIVGDPRRWWAEQLAARLPDGARVLELGCGSGVPDTRELAARFCVTGVDISAEQIRQARASVPDAEFLVADVTELELAQSSYDAVASFYVFNHVPRELLPALLESIHSWLVLGGFLLTAFGTSDNPGWTGDFLGAPSFFSSHPPDVNSRLVDNAGFERLLDEIVSFREPDGEATFQWVLARR